MLDVSVLGISVPTTCTLCHEPLLGSDTVYATEAQAPGQEMHGDPTRMLAWHKEHAPEWAVKLNG